MRIHREGKSSILLSTAFWLIAWGLCYAFWPQGHWAIAVLAFLPVAFFLQFFRNPSRQIPAEDASLVYAPADGKVVVIEETEEGEYLRDRRIQVSIFMSPLNVHVNRNPVSGRVAYCKYHPGKFMAAWHPKSSLENERTTIVYDMGREKILMRQIAGAVARRIVYYLKEGQEARQGEEMGFIKLGSRVDLFLPLDAEILVRAGQTVKGNLTAIARLKG